ncbi:hypothetical protein C8R43DRAFT_1190683 [Mycena crocata]|nr:hypothetical protein C8R43DRAFT_1190683 [Mycena crocata]
MAAIQRHATPSPPPPPSSHPARPVAPPHIASALAPPTCPHHPHPRLFVFRAPGLPHARFGDWLVFEQARWASVTQQSLFPVHAVVLAAHCAKLPRLPPPARSSASSAVLPVCPLALPSPQAFSILHAFMYTHRLDAALSALPPLPASFIESLATSYSSSASARGSPTPIALIHAALSAPQTRHAFSAHLCASATGNLSALMAHAGHVKELWQDMLARGIVGRAGFGVGGGVGGFEFGGAVSSGPHDVCARRA